MSYPLRVRGLKHRDQLGSTCMKGVVSFTGTWVETTDKYGMGLSE